MNFLFFIRSMSGGGAQRVMVRLASGFVDAGHTVNVVTLNKSGPFLKEMQDGVTINELPTKKLITSLPYLVYYLIKNKQDAIIVTEPASNVVLIVSKIIAFNKSKLFIREGLFPSVAIKETPHMATKIAYKLAPYIYRYADCIIAIANDMADDIKRFLKVPHDKVQVISYNPVVTTELFRLSEQEPDHKWFEDDVPIILGVGRLDKQKDFETLIKSFALLRREYKSRLMIIGEGPERNNLQKIIDESGWGADISLIGFRSNPFSAMARCTVFVLPSRYEGQPNVLVEALACNATVVSTDCPSGPREILSDGKYGKLVPVGDHVRMAEAILHAAKNPLNKEMLTERAQQYTVHKSSQLYIETISAKINIDDQKISK